MKHGLLFLSTLALLNFSCSKEEKPKGPNDEKNASYLTELALTPDLMSYTIVNESRQPIAGAQVLVGNAVNLVEQDNFIQTDSQGQFAIPTSWKTPQNLTIDANGYVRVTFLNEAPSARTIVLKKMKLAPSFEVKGVTSGHPIKDGDGLIDFSLVMSSMTKEDILNLDLNKVISPKSDKITVVGQDLYVPTNVSLPKQRESYIIGITLEKPAYRLYFDTEGPQHVYAARGRFQFKPVVDQLRNNVPFFDLINQFNITGGSVKDVSVAGPSTALDINVMDMNYTQKMNLQAPTIGTDQVIVAASVADMGGYLLPTDVKKLATGEKMALSVMQGRPALVAQVLQRKSEFMTDTAASGRLSGVLVPFTENTQTQFLGLVENPTHPSEFNYQLQAPQKPSSVNAIGTYMVISDIKDKDTAAQHRWEVYSTTWDTNVELPHWALGATPNKKRVEVSFIGSLNTNRTIMGPQVIEAATHVSRSAFDY